MSEISPHLLRAVELACQNANGGGFPFGAVLVRDGVVLAEAVNNTVKTHDPTAHAELVALRTAGQAAGTPDLQGAIVYASGEPCAMCFAAMRIAGVKEVIFAYSGADGAAYDMPIDWLYDEMKNPIRASKLARRHCPVQRDPDTSPFEIWAAQQD